MYDLNEIFFSVQGEGYWVGTPMLFLRFAGCNMNCPWCDTNHEKKFSIDTASLMSEIEEARKDHNFEHVCLTGGEPMLQLDWEILFALHQAGLRPHIETNGSVRPERVLSAWYTVSPKAPGQPIEIMFPNEIKIVNDGTWSKQQLRTLAAKHAGVETKFYLQPMDTDGSMNAYETIELIYELGSPWRLSCQVHKLIGLR